MYKLRKHWEAVKTVYDDLFQKEMKSGTFKRSKKENAINIIVGIMLLIGVVIIAGEVILAMVAENFISDSFIASNIKVIAIFYAIGVGLCFVAVLVMFAKYKWVVSENVQVERNKKRQESWKQALTQIFPNEQERYDFLCDLLKAKPTSTFWHRLAVFIEFTFNAYLVDHQLVNLSFLYGKSFDSHLIFVIVSAIVTFILDMSVNKYFDMLMEDRYYDLFIRDFIDSVRNKE